MGGGQRRWHAVLPDYRGAEAPALGYSVCLVDLEEGPRVLARLQDVPPREVPIGTAVRARIVRENDRPLLVFELAETEAHAKVPNEGIQ
ncbi:Zn-ribbon domain-containing OB-fold protein [Ottowia sp. VDI28]|uniref:Zn-ribbon domain-containing OB-fold protein n=1 Tax=Ottowia sp. VDI28 TaxID=3133968 RepID=UPI003C2CA6DB